MLNRNFYNRVNSNFLLIEYIHLFFRLYAYFRVRKKQDGEVKKPIYLKSLSMVYP